MPRAAATATRWLATAAAVCPCFHPGSPPCKQIPLADELNRVLASMEVRTVTQRERWFLQEMRKAREIKDQNLRKTELKKLERNLSQVQLHFLRRAAQASHD